MVKHHDQHISKVNETLRKGFFDFADFGKRKEGNYLISFFSLIFPALFLALFIQGRSAV
jgi:hypothetical protein